MRCCSLQKEIYIRLANRLIVVNQLIIPASSRLLMDTFLSIINVKSLSEYNVIIFTNFQINYYGASSG